MLTVLAARELIDTYHSQKATNRRDMIYALLGMSTDDPVSAGLLVDYGAPWETIFGTLITSSLSGQASVNISSTSNIATIRARAHLLGRVSSVQGARAGKQSISVDWAKWTGKERTQFAIWATARRTEAGDVVCLLRGSSKPTVIRTEQGRSYSEIIIASLPVSLAGPNERPDGTNLQLASTFPFELTLVWEWNPQPQFPLQDYEELAGRMDQQGRTSEPVAPWRAELHRAIRLGHVGTLLNGTGDYEAASRTLEKATNVYESATARCPDLNNSEIRDGEGGILALVIAAATAVENGGHPDETFRSEGLLSWAAKNGFDHLIPFLIDRCADPEAHHNGALTPLCWAARMGHENAARVLIDNGASLHTYSNDDRGPLEWAAEGRHESVIRLLLASGAGLRPPGFLLEPSHSTNTALQIASQNGQESIAKLLLDREADITGVDAPVWGYDRRMALHRASWGGHGGIVKLLLDASASVADDTRPPAFPLHAAAESGHTDIMAMLLNRGFGVGDTDDEGNQVLHCASRGGRVGRVEIVKQLLSRGAAMGAENNKGQHPLHVAIERGHMDVVKVLLDAGADSEARVGVADAFPILSFAVMQGYVNIVKLLLDRGAKVNERDGGGWTALHHAARLTRGAKVAELLLDAGADVGCTNGGDGKGALHIAAQAGNEGVVKLLLERGADANLLTVGSEWSAANFALEYKRIGALRLLLEAGADLDWRDFRGRRLLHRAAISADLEFVELLLRAGADVNAVEEDGLTALHDAARRGRQEVVEFLLDNGAELEAKNAKGETPLEIAASFGREEVVDALLGRGAVDRR